MLCSFNEAVHHDARTTPPRSRPDIGYDVTTILTSIFRGGKKKKVQAGSVMLCTSHSPLLSSNLTETKQPRLLCLTEPAVRDARARRPMCRNARSRQRMSTRHLNMAACICSIPAFIMFSVSGMCLLLLFIVYIILF